MSREKAVALADQAINKYGGLQECTPRTAEGVVFFRQGSELVQVVSEIKQLLEAKPEPGECVTKAARKQIKYYRENWPMASQDEEIAKGYENACDIIDRLTAENKTKDDEIGEFKRKYGDYEKLGTLANKDECDGDCDEKRPYRKCPECLASHALNELGGIMLQALGDLEQAQKAPAANERD